MFPLLPGVTRELSALLSRSYNREVRLKMKLSYPLITVCLVFLVSTANAQTGQGSITPDPAKSALPAVGETTPRYRIGYQDILEVQIFKHSELNRRVTINPDGTITLFRLDRPVKAVCKTETELAADIAAAYEKDYLRNPQVSVIAVEQKSQSVAVIGAVVKPGNFYINRPVQLLELLAYAGGPDPEKAGSRILVARPGSTSNCRIADVPPTDQDIKLMSFRIRDVQEAKQTLVMQPGDVVSVLDTDQVYVYGNVNKQKAVKMKEPITLTQAVVEAEGLKSASVMDAVRVLRQKPGSADREEIVYNLKEISRGKQPDPFLEPNDIVAVSQDKTRNIINNIGKSLAGGAGSVFYRIP